MSWTLFFSHHNILFHCFFPYLFLLCLLLLFFFCIFPSCYFFYLFFLPSMVSSITTPFPSLLLLFFLLYFYLMSFYFLQLDSFSSLGIILNEFSLCFPSPRTPPTLTCGSSQATEGYCSISLLVLTWPWTYCNIFITFIVSCRTSSSAFYKFSTRWELRCFNGTFIASCTRHCNLWYTRWITSETILASCCISSTLFA